MKRVLIAGMFLGCLSAIAQKTPQLDALVAARENTAPALLEYAPAFGAQESGRRDRLKWLKAQLDTLDIPESRRYRIMRDLYRGKEARWLEKYHLASEPGKDSLGGKGR